MATYLLDTSIIIDTLNGKNNRESLLEHLLQQGHLLACCPINVSEVYAGLRPKEEVLTQAFLKSLDYLDIPWEIARQAGLLKRDYARKGITLGIADSMIAAVAIHHRCTLVTDTLRDFPMKEVPLYGG
ncbi:MAG: type II toxin-antitoxin system VapC family toxin [Elusimicrobia bacterium]|nr:type II toxin-antitoxin system VapC family toxin [Elusimicrobiota bacterium]